MSQILQMRNQRAQLNDQLQALAKKEADGESLSAEELAEFGDLESQITALTDKISRAERAESLVAQVAVPVDKSARGINGPPNSPAIHVAGRHTAPEHGMAQMVRLLVQSGGDRKEAAEMAQKGGFGEDVQMALSTATPAGGGVLVPENFSTSVIESLRPVSVVRRMGAVSLPLNNGNMTLPRINGNTSVTYIGSDDDISVTGMSFEPLHLKAKKAAALVPISNDLLAFAGVSPAVDSLVTNDLATSMGLSEDLHFIRSAGSAVLPKGLRYWAMSSNVVAQPAGTPTLELIDGYLGGLMLRLENANVNLTSCGWLLAPRTIRWLQSLRDGNGNKAYPEIEQGQLKGYRFALTTQIPINLGAGGNESEIYFVNFADCYIGEVKSLSVAVSQEAAYKDANDEMVSAFQRDQTLIRVIAQHDFGPRHVESIAVGTGVTWGEGMLPA